MAYLYVNAKGKEVQSHSYSGGDTLKFCPAKYKLSRIDGWQEREKDLKASLKFGIAMESALRFHHENGMAGGPEEFVRLWTVFKDMADMKFTPVEHNWENLLLDGVELLKLYHIRLPLLPIDLSVAPTFQVKYWKELFPGTELAGIEFVAYVDMVCRSKDDFGDALGVDIKTSGMAFDSTENIASLDQQLRTYAWVTGIQNWAFLNLQKCGRSLERGSHVSLLEPVGEFWPGKTGVVIKYQEYEPAEAADPAKPKSKPSPEVPEELWIVESDEVIQEMLLQCGKGQKKEEKEAREAFIRANATLVPKTFVTKQRVQFVRAHIGVEEQLEAARQVGQDVAQIVHHNEQNFWPRTGGIRYPNTKCPTCPYRGICLDNKELRDQFLFRTDEEWDITTTEETE